MACIVALLDQEHKTNQKFFDEYLSTSRDVVAEAFLAEYKETPPLLQLNNTTPFVATPANMRFMGNNALENKTLVQEGTKHISRLIIAYTQGIQIQFNKVQNRRAEINRLRSQMLAEKKVSVTEATGKAILDLTEKENENGNNMEMKLVLIFDDRPNERCPSSVTAATKKEARKCAGEEINRLTSILKKHCIVTDGDTTNVQLQVTDKKSLPVTKSLIQHKRPKTSKVSAEPKDSGVEGTKEALQVREAILITTSILTTIPRTTTQATITKATTTETANAAKIQITAVKTKITLTATTTVASTGTANTRDTEKTAITTFIVLPRKLPTLTNTMVSKATSRTITTTITSMIIVMTPSLTSTMSTSTFNTMTKSTTVPTTTATNGIATTATTTAKTAAIITATTVSKTML
jgi:hypothetical protein